jgi:hypothetical protein
MPLVTLPDGQIVNVDDGAAPEVIARLKAAHPAKRGGGNVSVAKPKLNDEQAEVQRRVAHTRDGFGDSTQRKIMQGLTANFMDEIQGGVGAATQGVYRAIKHHDIHEIGKEYRVSRDTERALQDRDSGAGGTAAEILGSLMNPIGDGAKLLQSLKFAPRLVKAGQALDHAPAIAKALLAGGNQGAVNALGSAKDSSDLAGTAMQGYGAGALSGAAFGGAAHGVRRASQILSDRGTAAAERTAYTRIAHMLENGNITPDKARRELTVTNARGGDGMVMDLTPGLRAQAAAISRRPNVPLSNELIARGESRIDARPDLFEQQVRGAIKPGTGQDADALKANIKGAQKAHGAANYDQVLGKNFVWNDDLEKFVREAPPVTQQTMKDAVKLVLNERVDPTSLGIKFNDAGDVVFDKVPSMRVFDYMKRAFDHNIGQALRSGDKNTARILSGELGALKDGIAKSNPEYGQVLAQQRDFFQKTQAVETGLSVIKRLRREPKMVLSELRKLDPAMQDDARTGIVEAVIGMRNTNADPVKFMRSVMRTPHQRKVMEFAFNGKGNLARFERWMNRELRATRADVLTAPGRQSETARFDMADESMKGNIGGAFMDAMRGFAFGGPAGATAATVRKLQDLRTGTGEAAMNSMAKILMSDGSDLKEGLSAAQKYAKARKASNARAAVAAAKMGQQPFTDYTGK